MVKQITRGAGAAFGIPMNLYDFGSSNQNFEDLKKYELFIPKFINNLSHAYRWYSQGAERNAAGNAVVKFNPADTEQMMEILARVGGRQPRRLTEKWGRMFATGDAANFWNLKRQGLMRQFAEAVRTQDQESKDKVIEAIKRYNKDLPEEARGKGINAKELQDSFV